MAAGFKVGRVAMRTTTGTTAITGVGFAPQIVFLYADDSTPFASEGGTAQQFTLITVGMASSTTQEVCACATGDCLALTMDTAKSMRTDCTLDCTFWGGTSDERVDISAFGADGFTLNFTTVQAGFAGSIHWVAIGGDFSDAQVGTFELATSTGAQSVTGMPFEPELVFFLSISPVTAAATLPIASQPHARLMFGAAGSATQEWVGIVGLQDATATEDVTNIFRSDACIHLLTAASGATEAVADFTSMNSDGFSINVSDAAAGSGRWVAYGAVGGGGQVKVGVETKPLSATTKATTGSGFTPKGAFFYSINRVASGSLSTTTAAGWSFGASDGTTENYITLNAADAAAASGLISGMDDDKALQIPISSAAGAFTTTNEANLQSFDSDGFTLNWTTANANAFEFGYVLFGDTPSAPPAQIPRGQTPVLQAISRAATI